MGRIAAVLCLAALAACGADGPPLAPVAKQASAGVTLSGAVQVGIARDGGK